MGGLLDGGWQGVDLVADDEASDDCGEADEDDGEDDLEEEGAGVALLHDPRLEQEGFQLAHGGGGGGGEGLMGQERERGQKGKMMLGRGGGRGVEVAAQWPALVGGGGG